ncbi:MAG: type II toxin-antitoxin system RelE/ParE family toxin [Bacillota bacterium]|jgi:mRNA interferase RelE/StbE|nr:type II toxin-antitoxin system RelE/ParE family toxin [Bacillota bacterium]MDI9414530.1 type II toxin-antitoxin system RelE/ParE family toxin [Bacillota bacterium]NLD13202.1 type II toxin-antitoxin system RelE/ParE family toxin [Bacillota bacterium]HCD41922.1 plasmid stabilization protein [Bacillota bacterium]HOB88801.1 type II toxin-antitoxin system RelE/ParE family toxin [Bacillota bacterium]
MYDLRFSSSAERYLKKLKDRALKDAYKTAFLSIMKNPYIGSRKVGDLWGVYGFDFRHRGVSYEIAYVIREGNKPVVVVLLAGTRENFYQQLKRYMK